MASKKRVKKSSGHENSRLVAFLSYFLVGIIWYYIDKGVQKDKFVKFHVKQGIIFVAFWMVWNILLILFSSVIPGDVINLLELVPWIFVVLGVINVINGKMEVLPLIGEYGKKLDL
jgi:uncharacterized membrane protein